MGKWERPIEIGENNIGNGRRGKDRNMQMERKKGNAKRSIKGNVKGNAKGNVIGNAKGNAIGNAIGTAKGNAKRECQKGMPKGNAYWERGKTKIQIKNLPLVSSSKEIEISVKSGGSSLTALNKTEDFG